MAPEKSQGCRRRTDSSRPVFSFSRIKSDPNAKAYVADFTALGTQIADAAQMEVDLDDAVSDAEAGAIAADAGLGGLDVLVDLVLVAIHGAKKHSVDDPLHQLYCGSQTGTA